MKSLTAILLGIALMAIGAGAAFFFAEQNMPSQPSDTLTPSPQITRPLTTISPGETATDTSDWVPYKNQLFAYSILVPPDYTVRDATTGGTSAVDGTDIPLDTETAQFSSPPLDNGGNVVITITWSQDIRDPRLAQYEKALTDQGLITKNGQRLDMIYASEEQENLSEADSIIPVNDGTYVMGVIADTPIGPRGSSFIIFTFEKKRYVIQIESTAGSYEEIQNQVEPILKTLFLSPQP